VHRLGKRFGSGGKSPDDATKDYIASYPQLRPDDTGKNTGNLGALSNHETLPHRKKKEPTWADPKPTRNLAVSISSFIRIDG
jgi:hypothetical protein